MTLANPPAKHSTALVCSNTVLIDLTLGGALLKYLPVSDPSGSHPAGRAASNRTQLDIEDGSSVADALRVLGVPPEARMMVICDGNVVSPEEFATTTLISGSNLSVIPPIQAG